MQKKNWNFDFCTIIFYNLLIGETWNLSYVFYIFRVCWIPILYYFFEIARGVVSWSENLGPVNPSSNPAED
jgi:uncharacterized membrane protein